MGAEKGVKVGLEAEAEVGLAAWRQSPVLTLKGVEYPLLGQVLVGGTSRRITGL